MKLSTRIGTSLTLLMFLLVLSAVVLFLLQGRGDLIDQRANLAATRDSLSAALTQSDTARATAEAAQLEQSAALATASVDLLTSETIRDNLQTERDDLNETVATVSAEYSAAATAAADWQQQQRDLRAEPPVVELLNIADGDQVPPGSPIPLVIAASDAYGLTAINLSINGETVMAHDAADATLETLRYDWLPTVEEAVTINVMAVDVDGHASVDLTITVEVVDFAARNAALQAEVEANVADLRGLPFRDPVRTFQINQSDLQQVVANDFLGEAAAAILQDQALVYAAFNFMPRDFDLLALQQDVFSSFVAGYYDPVLDELVVVTNAGEFGPFEELTLAHEYTHALQDQYFDLDGLYDAVTNSDQALALRALGEGEARLIEGLYNSEYLTAEEASSVAAQFGDAPAPELIGNPAYIFLATLAFPYTAGADYVQAIYTQSGFAGINAAWTNPPASTEQILHPDETATNVPIPVPLPPLTPTLGADWRLLADDVMGEFRLRLFLERQLNEAQVDTAATGWGGDHYAVYYHDENDELVLLWRLVWDTPEDLNEFNAGFFNYAENQYGPGSLLPAGDDSCWQGPVDVMCLFVREGEAVVVRAPDMVTAQAVAVSLDGGDTSTDEESDTDA